MEQQIFAWFRGHWSEEPVPAGEPETIYVEVALESDSVIRMVEVFADGRAIARNAIEEGVPSLVHGPFLGEVEVNGQVSPIVELEFVQIWAKCSAP